MNGLFWLSDKPETRRTGRLNIDEGSLLLSDGYLVDEYEVKKQTASSTAYVLRSLTHLEFILHGDMDDGSKVTVPHALAVPAIGSQEFRFLYVIEGGHLTGEQRYVAALVDLGDPYAQWMRRSALSGTLTLPSHGAVALTTTSHLEFSVLPRLTQEQIERDLVHPILNLLTLVSGEIPHVLAFQLRPVLDGEESDAVYSVKRKRSRRDSQPAVSEGSLLFPIGPDGIAALNAWYDLDRRLRPTCSVIAKSTAIDSYDVELRMFNLAAAAEAVHRGLYDSKQMNFGDRLRDLLDSVGPLADVISGPSLASPPEKELGRDLWVKIVKGYRNTFAHQQPHAPDDLREYSGQMLVLYESLRWLLTTVLLCHVGRTPAELQPDLGNASPYWLFRERAKLLWPDIYDH